MITRHAIDASTKHVTVVCTYVCMYVSTYIHTYVRIHPCMYVYVCGDIHVADESFKTYVCNTRELQKSQSITVLPHVISGFRSKTEESCVLLGYYPASSGNLPFHNHYQITPPKK
jgi:hypothetical protein